MENDIDDDHLKVSLAVRNHQSGDRSLVIYCTAVVSSARLQSRASWQGIRPSVHGTQQYDDWRAPTAGIFCDDRRLFLGLDIRRMSRGLWWLASALSPAEIL